MWRALTSRTQDLESLVLDEQSVPAEFALLVQERVDNQARAEGWPDPESMEANYDAWGRLAGIYSEYNTGTSIGHFWSRISMYRTEAGAREAFDYYRQGGQNASIQGFQEAGFSLDEFEDLVDPNIGDESFAFYGSFSDATYNTNNTWTPFRKDNLISLLSWRSDTNEAQAPVQFGIAKKQL
jgi:hypothetical protein